jgi:predicted Co/Zn/Cd cation transporter (cation efflux family)
LYNEDNALVGSIEAVLADLKAEHDIVRTIRHLARSGRTVFIEIDLLVGPGFARQTVARQDGLRQRFWTAMDLPLDRAWLSIALTAHARWV